MMLIPLWVIAACCVAGVVLTIYDFWQRMR